MLHQFFTLLHELGVVPHLLCHRIEEVFIDPPGDPPTLLLTTGTLATNGTGAAGGRGVILHVTTMFERLEAIGQFGTSRTPIAVTGAVLVKVRFGKEALLFVR